MRILVHGKIRAMKNVTCIALMGIVFEDLLKILITRSQFYKNIQMLLKMKQHKQLAVDVVAENPQPWNNSVEQIQLVCTHVYTKSCNLCF